MAKDRWTTFDFEAGPLGASDLTVSAFEGTEALSEPYHLIIDAFPHSDQPLELRDFLGAKGCLRIARPQGEERFFNGVISRVELISVSKGPAQYRFHLVPRFQTLENVRQSRIFQSLSVPDVVKKVLKEGNVEHRVDLRQSYSAQEYCVQYRESNRDFVQRLLEDEGIFFYFEHPSDKHVMVLVDSPKACPNLSRSSPLPIHLSQGQLPHEEHLFSFGRRRRVVPSTVSLKDFDFEKPTLALLAQAQASGDPEKLEVYEWPGGHDSDTEGKRRSQIHLEELRFGAQTCEGAGTCVSMAPGYLFEVGEKEGAAPIKLLAVRVRHSGVKQRAPSAEIVEDYSNIVTAVDANGAYRPLRKTRCPTIPGLQSATVVGPSAEEIHVDSYGRIKVQFHWDREGKRDDHSSCWIRLAQPWAGAGMGTSVVPRIGQEVLVRFVEGDPDQPLALGALYNGALPPAIKLPDDKTKSTLITDSTKSADGFNQLRFEDSKNEEEVFIHGQKDLQIRVEHDKAQSVDGREELGVGGKRSRTVIGNQLIRVNQNDVSRIDGNQSLKVVGNRKTMTAGDQGEEVSRNQSITVASQEVSVAMASSTEVLAAAALTIGGGLLITVGGALNHAVGGAKLSEVGGASVEQVGGSRSRSVEKDSSSKIGGDDRAQVGKSVALKVGEDLKEDVGGKTQSSVTEQIGWMADAFQLKAQKVTIAVAEKVALTIDNSGNIKFFGDSMTVDGSKLQLKGSEIKKAGGAGSESKSVSIEKLKEAKSKGLVRAAFQVPEGGGALGGLKFELKLPDGTTKKGTVGDDGSISSGGVKPGQCEITFKVPDNPDGH